MRPLDLLVDQVQRVNADEIELPVLRELVKEIQTKSAEQLCQDAKYWSDTNWRQWRQHSSHNPW